MLIVGIFGMCAYSFSFFALVVYQTLRAPRAFIEDPDFKVKYKFMLGKFQPDRYWFSVVGLLQALLLNIISTFSRNSFAQMYFTIVLFIIFASVQVALWPWKFQDINLIDIMNKLAIMLILILGTSCVRGSEDTRKKSVEVFKYFMLAFVVMPLLFIAYVICRAFYRRCFTNKAARDIAFTQNFHNTMLLAGFRSNQDLHKFVSSLPDADYRVCRKFVDVMLAQMYHWQPGPKFRQKRLITATSHYTVASSKRLVRLLSNLSDMGYAVGPAFEERQLLLTLSMDLRKAVETDEPVLDVKPTQQRASVAESVNAFMSTVVDTMAPVVDMMTPTRPQEQVLNSETLCNKLGLAGDDELNCDDFVKLVSPLVETLHADDIEKVFNFIDIDRSGAVSIDELVTLMDGVVNSTGATTNDRSSLRGFVVDDNQIYMKFTLHVWRKVILQNKQRRIVTNRKLAALEVKGDHNEFMAAEKHAAVKIKLWWNRYQKRRAEKAAKTAAAISTLYDGVRPIPLSPRKPPNSLDVQNLQTHSDIDHDNFPLSGNCVVKPSADKLGMTIRHRSLMTKEI
jgi:hypothetical protein